MSYLLLNVFLALAWISLTAQFTPLNFLEGFVVAYGVLWLTHRAFGGSPAYFLQVPRVLGFLAYFVKELIVANLRVAHDVLTPRHHMRPAIVAVPLDAASDLEITLLANILTLTPGTLSLDVSDDRRVLFVHCMYVRDVEQAKRDIKEGFERRLLEILR